MQVKLSASPTFKFKAIGQSGYSFDIGASPSIGGDGLGMRPMELVLAAIGSCSAVDVVSILKKSRVEFDAVEVEVDGKRQEGAVPSPFTDIHIAFIVRGTNVDLKKAERAVALGVEKYCSVAVMLAPTVAITHSTRIQG